MYNLDFVGNIPENLAALPDSAFQSESKELQEIRKIASLSLPSSPDGRGSNVTKKVAINDLAKANEILARIFFKWLKLPKYKELFCPVSGEFISYPITHPELGNTCLEPVQNLSDPV